MSRVVIDSGYFENYRILKLQRILGPGSEVYPIKLWLMAAKQRGFNGYFKETDLLIIEALAGWPGEQYECANRLVEAEVLQWRRRSAFLVGWPNTETGYIYLKGGHSSGRTAECRQELLRVARARGTHTDLEWEAMKAINQNRCCWCQREEELSKDHIIPLGEDGSDDSIFNIQPLCRSCNSKKGTSSKDFRDSDWGASIASYMLQQGAQWPGIFG